MAYSNLNALFDALFTAEKGETAVIRGFDRRPSREEYFQMFFPDALCSQYLSKTKANLTWFYASDEKNKAIKNTLIRMLREDPQGVITAVQQKCRDLLWPQGQHPAFRREDLWQALNAMTYPANLNNRLRIRQQPGNPGDADYALEAFFEADPSAALARTVLSLGVMSEQMEDRPELLAMMTQLWTTAPSREPEPGLQDIPGRIRYGNLLYISGDHAGAFRIYEATAAGFSGPARDREESRMLCRMGRMLLTGDGHYRDEAAARDCLLRACREDNPQAYYLLSRLCEAGEGAALLEKAAALGHGPALRELGNRFFFGEDRDPEKALGCFSAAAGAGEDVAYCACMQGRIYEELGRTKSAIQAYRIASEKGSIDAARRLEEWSVFPETAAAPAETGHALRYCLMNTDTGANAGFARSLPGPWEVTVGSVNALLPTLSQTLFSPEATVFPELVIALLSEDPEENLSQAVQALGILELRARQLGGRKWDMAQSVTIYVKASHDYAALMLDGAYAGVRSVTIPLRLCDSARDSADALFTSAPLFLPCLLRPETEQINLVVLGTSETAMVVVRRAAAMPLTENRPVTITVLGEDADRAALRFQESCPGIWDAAPEIRRSIPEFISCDLSGGALSAALRELKKSRQEQKEASGESLPQRLLRGNYFVIATDCDRQNLQLATTLRSRLLTLDPSFTNLPFLAVAVRDPAAARLAENLSADGKNGAGSWHSRYGLHCFGSDDQYTYENLKNDLVERRAMAVHLQYAANMPRHLALESYYRRQYNRDSSRAVALYLTTRLFCSGLALPDWKLYGIPEAEATLASGYRAWLEKEDNLLAAARLEHGRWNCYMLSTGWEQASLSQVSTYVLLGNPAHQLYIGKLHPFLCPWEMLEDGILRTEVERLLRQRLPEKSVHDPCDADTETARAAADLLTVF